MGKNRKTSSVLNYPRDDLTEKLGIECQLTTSPWMRTDCLVVHPPDDQPERFACSFTKLLGAVATRSIEIDMRVIARDGAHEDLLPLPLLLLHRRQSARQVLGGFHVRRVLV